MANTALLVVDVQVGMFAQGNPVYRGDELLASIGSLLKKARQSEIPIIYIQQGSERPGHPLEKGTPGWQIHPAIAPQTGEVVVPKCMPDAFYETNLRQELVARGVKNLVITGIQTELCVDATCRQACSLSYDVTLVADAHSTWDRGALSAAQIIAHHNSLLGDWFTTLKQGSEITFHEQDAPAN
jgi:nicotinamidase-related amidase